MWLPLLIALGTLLLADASHAQACNPAYTEFCLIEPTGADGQDVAPYCFLPTLGRGQYETNYAVTGMLDGECHSFVTYLRFQLPGDLLEPGETVTQATLLLPYLFSFTFGGTPTPPPHPPVTIRLHRVMTSWTEDAVTWVDRPSFDTAPAAEVTGVTHYGIKEFDVTDLVRSWAHGTQSNYGFVVTSPNDRTLGFYSFEAPVSTAQKAALLIQAGAGDPPAVPMMPAWIAALLVLGVATLLAIRMPRSRDR